MNLLPFLLLLLCMMPLLLGQSAAKSNLASGPTEARALVQNLYREVVALHPLGIPSDRDMKVLAPYLSKQLLHRFDINLACQGDWDRQHPGPDSKPPFLEFGLFSGDDMRAQP